MGRPSSLAGIFVEHLRGRRPEWDQGSDDQLEQRLREVHAEAAARWRGIDLPAALFARHLAGMFEHHLAQVELPREIAPVAWLDELQIADLYLACACRLGMESAIKTLDRQFVTLIPRFIAYMNQPAAFVDEVAQIVREKIFVDSPAAAAKLTEFFGRGTLASWVRVLAVRTAVDLMRQRGRVSEAELPEAAADVLYDATSPELEILKQRYLEDYTRAVSEAVLSLSKEDRNLLHMKYIGQLTTTQIGDLFGRDHSTISRRLATAREAIFAQTKRLLRERLRITSAEFDSLTRLVQSQLDISITRLLQAGPGEDESGGATNNS